MLSDLLSGTYLTLSVIAHQFLKTTQTAAPVSLLVLSLSVCRSTARDADTCGEENLSVPAHGLHPIGHPVVSDTTVQTPLRTHQKWQVSSGDTFFFIYIYFLFYYINLGGLCVLVGFRENPVAEPWCGNTIPFMFVKYWQEKGLVRVMFEFIDAYSRSDQ